VYSSTGCNSATVQQYNRKRQQNGATRERKNSQNGTAAQQLVERIAPAIATVQQNCNGTAVQQYCSTTMQQNAPASTAVQRCSLQRYSGATGNSAGDGDAGQCNRPQQLQQCNRMQQSTAVQQYSSAAVQQLPVMSTSGTAIAGNPDEYPTVQWSIDFNQFRVVCGHNNLMKLNNYNRTSILAV
jgi:uncharacterized protein YukE